jgi:hypothetical protein
MNDIMCYTFIAKIYLMAKSYGHLKKQQWLEKFNSHSFKMSFEALIFF